MIDKRSLTILLLLLASYLGGRIVWAQTEPTESCPENARYSERWEQAARERSYSTSSAWNITDISVSPEGDRLAIANSAQLAIYDPYTLELIQMLDSGKNWDTFHQFGISWSPENLRLAVTRYIYTMETPSPSSGVQVWDIENNRLLATLPIETETVAWSSDGTVLASMNFFGEIVFWDIDHNVEVTPRAFENKVYEGILFSPDGEFLAAFNIVGTLDLWKLWTEQSPHLIETGITSSDDFLTWSPDSSMLAVGSDLAGVIQLWNAQTETLTNTLQPSQSSGNMLDLQWSPDGSFIAEGTNYGLLLWDMMDSLVSEPISLVENMPEFVRIAWMPDGDSLFSVAFDGSVYKWAIPSGCILGIITPTDEVE